MTVQHNRHQRDDFDPNGYHPRFRWAFVAPKYWGIWLGLLLLAPLALLPNGARVWLARNIAKLMLRRHSTACHRARVNLQLCFPEQSSAERERLILDSFTTAGAFLLGFPSLTLRSRNWLTQNSIITGLEHITQHTDKGRNIILLVPHSWTIDIPAVLFASLGLPVVGFVKQQKNQLVDWLMHRQRVQYGGRIYERSVGIKPFIQSIRQGYLGYYLPDQDHGREQSVFVDFFATTKATLPGMAKITKISRAKVIPIFSGYNTHSGKYEIAIYPEIKTLETGTPEGDAQIINTYIESVVAKQPEQYMWNLRLLNTQKNGLIPYHKNYFQESAPHE